MPVDPDAPLPAATLEADPLWRFFTYYNSLADFEAAANLVSFRREVPTEVNERFEPVRALIRFSYFDASLLDVAHERALFSFELALKCRHQELGAPLGGKPTLARLIAWAGDNHLFEDEVDAAHSIRHLRNTAAHPNPGSTYSLRYHALLSTLSIPRFINGLYDDPGLRRERKEERRKVNSSISEIAREGAVLDLSARGGPRLLIFLAKALHFENRLERRTNSNYVAFWPLFDPTPVDDGVDYGKPVMITFTTWWKEGEKLHFLDDMNGSPAILEPISSGENRDRFDQWREELQHGPVELHIIKASASFQLAELRIKLMNQTETMLLK